MPRWVRSVLVALVLASLVWASWRNVSRQLSIEGMRTLLGSHARYAQFVFMTIVVGAIFTHIPMAGTLVIAIGAVVLGTFTALLYGWVAALAGATSTFLLVRYVARDYLQHIVYGFSTRLRVFDDRLTRHGFLTVFGLRLVLGLAPLLDWGLGVTGVRTRDYVVATAVGVVPNMLLRCSSLM